MFKKLSQIFGSLGIITIGAILCAWGGQEKKWLRRFVYPAILTLYAISIVHNWWVLSIFTISIWLSIGYGIPEAYKSEPNELFNPNKIDFKIGFSDEGSFLGRFFYKLFKGNRLYTNIFTRGIIGLLISLSILSIPILTGHWWSYLCGAQGIIAVWAGVSWRDFGQVEVKLFGKAINLLKVDLTCYFTTTCGIITIIHGFFG